MKNKLRYLFFGIIAIFTVACQKEKQIEVPKKIRLVIHSENPINLKWNYKDDQKWEFVLYQKVYIDTTFYLKNGKSVSVTWQSEITGDGLVSNFMRVFQNDIIQDEFKDEQKINYFYLVK